MIKVTSILNKYVFTEHVFGTNDCNIILADYLDSLLGTDYYEKLFNKYDSIESGLKVAKKAGLNSPKYVLEKHAKKVKQAQTGDVLLNKAGNHWSVSIVFKDQMIAEINNKYQMISLSLHEKTLIYRIGE